MLKEDDLARFQRDGEHRDALCNDQESPAHKLVFVLHLNHNELARTHRHTHSTPWDGFLFPYY